MPAKKNIFTRTMPDGRLELSDPETDRVIGVQKMSKKNALRIAQGKKPIDFGGVTRYCWRNNKNGVPLFVQWDQDADDLPDDFQLFPMTPSTMLTVVQMVADGKTLRNIQKIPGMPPISVVMRWCAKDEEFKEAIQEARKSRAEVYHDAIEEVAFKAREDNAKSSKVKIDALKFLAGVNDRDRFGNQTKVTGDLGQSVNIIFHTGIEREKTIEVEAVTQEEVKLENDKPSED